MPVIGRRFPPMHIDVTHLHELHAARLAAWGLPSGDAYEDDVVSRCLDWARGVKPEPIAHAHAIEETGVCLECDAAGLIAAWRDDDRTPPKSVATAQNQAGALAAFIAQELERWGFHVEPPALPDTRVLWVDADGHRFIVEVTRTDAR